MDVFLNYFLLSSSPPLTSPFYPTYISFIPTIFRLNLASIFHPESGMGQKIELPGLKGRIIKLNGELCLQPLVDRKTAANLSLQDSDSEKQSDAENSHVHTGAHRIKVPGLEVQLEPVDGKLDLDFKGKNGVTLKFSYDRIGRPKLMPRRAIWDAVKMEDNATNQGAMLTNAHPLKPVHAHAEKSPGKQDTPQSNGSAQNNDLNVINSEISCCKNKFAPFSYLTN